MAFNPREIRDPNGKWTSGGGHHLPGDGGKAEADKRFGGGHVAKLDALEAELKDLEANHAKLPIAELKERRSAGMKKATDLLDQLTDHPDRASFHRAHELVLAFDQVGY